MMSDEEWQLFFNVYECVKLLCSTRVGIGSDGDSEVRRQALQTRLEAQYQAAYSARTTRDKTEADLQQRIADLERELEEARAKIPRQLRVTD